MRDLTDRVFEYLKIVSPIDVEKRMVYTQRILGGAALLKYQDFLVIRFPLAKELAGDEWTLGKLARISAKYFWNRAKPDTTGYDRHDCLDWDKCVNFERYFWFELGKCVWGNHWSVYQLHTNYVRNDIVKPFKVKFLHYAKHVRKMYELANYLPPPSMKGNSDNSANWIICNQKFTAGEVRLAIKDRFPSSMQDELEDHPEEYFSLTYEYWCDLLSIIEVKDEGKICSRADQ